MLTFTKTATALLISPTEVGRTEALGVIAEGKSTRDAFFDFMEPFIANGWSFVEPADIGALTAADIISEDTWLDDNGKMQITPGGCVYAHMDYQVEDPVKTWSDGKTVTFVRSDVENK